MPMPSLTVARLLPPSGSEVSCACAKPIKASWINAAMMAAVVIFFIVKVLSVNVIY